MAFVMKGPGPKGGTAYNVEQAVGKNSPNAGGDVKLVQYMLRNIYGSQAAGLSVDGYIGPVTAGWIDKFQKDMKAQGANVLADGRIDRAFGAVSTVSKTTYSILLMNAELKKRNSGAFGALPGQVALNAAPKSNPYNPKAKVMVDYEVVLLEDGKKRVTYKYADGTKETFIVTGNVNINGKNVQGEAELIMTETYYNGNVKHVNYYYSDGSSMKTSFLVEPVPVH